MGLDVSDFGAEIIFGEVRADGLHVAETLRSWADADMPIPGYILKACADELKRLARIREAAAQQSWWVE